MKFAAILASAVLGCTSLLSAADPQLLSMLPPNAKVIAGVNVDQARNSPFGQFVLSMMPIEPGLQQFVSTTGFDPRNDLHEILIAATVDPTAGPSHLVMAKGNFDVQKLLSLLPAGAQRQNYGGAQLVTVGSHDGAFAFLDANTAVAGDPASVMAALDRRLQASALDPVIAARIAELSATEDAWAVSTLPLSMMVPPAGTTPAAPGIAGNLLSSDLLNKIQQASGGVKFGASVQLSASAVTADAKDATALRDVVKFLALMAQSSAPKEAAPAVALLQTLNVTATGSDLKLDLTIPENQLEALLTTAAQSERAVQQEQPRRMHSGPLSK